MKIIIFALVLISILSLLKGCTPSGQDPYQTGSLVDCCSGSHQQLKNWDPSDPSKTFIILFLTLKIIPDRWYYLCQPDSQSGLTKGLALIPNNHNCGDIAALGSSWFYNWGTNAADCGNNGVNNLFFSFFQAIY